MKKTPSTEQSMPGRPHEFVGKLGAPAHIPQANAAPARQAEAPFWQGLTTEVIRRVVSEVEFAAALALIPGAGHQPAAATLRWDHEWELGWRVSDFHERLSLLKDYVTYCEEQHFADLFQAAAAGGPIVPADPQPA
ncbi:hypothetical protein [Geopseudomonas aromaticivorans]